MPHNNLLISKGLGSIVESLDSGEAQVLEESFALVTARGPRAFVRSLSRTSEMNFEREAGYLVPIERLEQTLAVDELTSCRILQAYFPKLYVPIMTRLLLELRQEHDLPRGISMTSARIRKITTAVDTSFILEVKGPKEGPLGSAIERPELGVSIDREMFDKLSRLATKGAVEKVRYFQEGFIDGVRGQRIPVTAEIDFTERLGPLRGSRPRYVAHEDLPFARVEIEISGFDELYRLRGGFHSFDYLAEFGVEIAPLEKSLRKSISSKRLAQFGIDKSARRAFKELLKRAA